MFDPHWNIYLFKTERYSFLKFILDIKELSIVLFFILLNMASKEMSEMSVNSKN